MPERIKTVPGMGRSIIDHDPRNRAYPARGVLFAADAPLRDRVWRRGQAYDQGSTPQCVAYTGKGMLNTAPTSAGLPYWTRSRIDPATWYAEAQARDEWPGNDYAGTSALGLLRFLTEAGIVREFRWCFGIDDVLRTLSHHGPVGVGTWWQSKMFHPGERALLTCEGEYIGGHEYQLIGIDPEVDEVIGMNSWGTGFGDRGRFRMKFRDLDRLLRDGGDAFTLVA